MFAWCSRHKTKTISLVKTPTLRWTMGLPKYVSLVPNGPCYCPVFHPFSSLFRILISKSKESIHYFIQLSHLHLPMNKCASSLLLCVLCVCTYIDKIWLFRTSLNLSICTQGWNKNVVIPRKNFSREWELLEPRYNCLNKNLEFLPSLYKRIQKYGTRDESWC